MAVKITSSSQPNWPSAMLQPGCTASMATGSTR
jgi:hypothetical protein